VPWNEVASVGPATGEPVPAVVTATPVTLFEGTIYDITVDPGEPGGGDETTISATGEHPFLVARAGPRAAALDTRADPEAVALVEPLDTRDRTGQDRAGQDLAGHGRWVPARDLAEGDAVRTMSPQGVAGTATVTKIRGRHAVVSVYNLTVEGTSRYLVGACGVVVHNKGEGAGGGGAASSLNAARLTDHLYQLERYGPSGFKQLRNGRYRYYGEIKPAHTPGSMVGRRLVREWDPATGATRSWHETIDQMGNIRIVRPVTQSWHYTFDELGNYTGRR
jgi:hypothetical protein